MAGVQQQRRAAGECCQCHAVSVRGKLVLRGIAQHAAAWRCGLMCYQLSTCASVRHCLQCLDAVGWAAERASACKKTEWWGAGVVICLEVGADLHMDQLISLPLTVSCFSKIQIGFPFLVPAHPGSPGQKAVKRVCVCVCVRACVRACVCVCVCSCVRLSPVG